MTVIDDAVEPRTPALRRQVDTAHLASLRSRLAERRSPRWRKEALAEAERQLGIAWWRILHTRPVRWHVEEPADGEPPYRTDHVSRDVTTAMTYLDQHSRSRRDAAGRLPHHHSTTRLMPQVGAFGRYYLPISEATRTLIFAAAAEYLAVRREIETRHLQLLAAGRTEIDRLEAAIRRAEAAAAQPEEIP